MNEDTPPLPTDVVLPFDDGKVEAHGTVWKLYFTGKVPTDEQLAAVLGSIGAVKTQLVADGATARVTPTLKEDNNE